MLTKIHQLLQTPTHSNYKPRSEYYCLNICIHILLKEYYSLTFCMYIYVPYILHFRKNIYVLLFLMNSIRKWIRNILDGLHSNTPCIACAWLRHQAIKKRARVQINRTTIRVIKEGITNPDTDAEASKNVSVNVNIKYKKEAQFTLSVTLIQKSNRIVQK